MKLGGLAGSLLLLLAALVVAATPARVRVGVLKFGTVSWELDVMQTHGLAAREGIDLQVVTLASTNATTVALQGGAVDLIVTDWTWVSRQRAEGRPFTFVPYSLTVGGLIVRPDSGIPELGDLRGKRLGVAGGPVDKSWLFFARTGGGSSGKIWPRWRSRASAGRRCSTSSCCGASCRRCSTTGSTERA